jgi:hypothetical protein
LQLKGSSNGTPQPQPRAADPFSVLPPLVVQGTPNEEEAVEEVVSSVELNARQVPELPALPVAMAPRLGEQRLLLPIPPGNNPATASERVRIQPLQALQAMATAPERVRIQPLQALQAMATAPERVRIAPLQALQAMATAPERVRIAPLNRLNRR